VGGRGVGSAVIVVGASAVLKKVKLRKGPTRPLSTTKKREVGDSHEAGYGCKSATTNFQRSQTAFTNMGGDYFSVCTLKALWVGLVISVAIIHSC